MNLRAEILAIVHAEQEAACFLATVTAVSGRTVQFRPVDASQPIRQYFACAKSYAAPAVNDVVLVLKAGSGYVALTAIG